MFEQLNFRILRMSCLIASLVLLGACNRPKQNDKSIQAEAKKQEAPPSPDELPPEPPRPPSAATSQEVAAWLAEVRTKDNMHLNLEPKDVLNAPGMLERAQFIYSELRKNSSSITMIYFRNKTNAYRGSLESLSIDPNTSDDALLETLALLAQNHTHLTALQTRQVSFYSYASKLETDPDGILKVGQIFAKVSEIQKKFPKIKNISLSDREENFSMNSEDSWRLVVTLSSDLAAMAQTVDKRAVIFDKAKFAITTYTGEDSFVGSPFDICVEHIGPRLLEAQVHVKIQSLNCMMTNQSWDKRFILFGNLSQGLVLQMKAQVSISEISSAEKMLLNSDTFAKSVGLYPAISVDNMDATTLAQAESIVAALTQMREDFYHARFFFAEINVVNEVNCKTSVNKSARAFKICLGTSKDEIQKLLFDENGKPRPI